MELIMAVVGDDPRVLSSLLLENRHESPQKIKDLLFVDYDFGLEQ